MNKKTQGELTRAILESLSVADIEIITFGQICPMAILESLSVADIEAILREKKNAQIAHTRI